MDSSSPSLGHRLGAGCHLGQDAANTMQPRASCGSDAAFCFQHLLNAGRIVCSKRLYNGGVSVRLSREMWPNNHARVKAAADIYRWSVAHRLSAARAATAASVML